MKFTPGQLEKAKAAKAAEELLALAKENGIELTDEDAAKYFAELHKEGALADDELDNVAGGGCGGDSSTPKAKFSKGTYVQDVFNPDIKGYVVSYMRNKDLFNGEYIYEVRSACDERPGEIFTYRESELKLA